MENRYTSLELSKKLWENGCRIDEKYVFSHFYAHDTFWKKYILIAGGNPGPIRSDYNPNIWQPYNAFDILWDICVKYAKEFFGEHYLEHTSRIFQFISATNCNAQMKTMLEDSMGIVENYIWTNCCFNKVKKEATNAKT